MKNSLLLWNKKKPFKSMDILISQDFFPEVGGAHKWIYEVYKRWPTPVIALVRDYSDDHRFAEKQKKFDILNHGSLNIKRYDLATKDINFFDPNCVQKIFHVLNILSHHIKYGVNKIHCIRAFPEGIVATLLKKISTKKLQTIIYAHGEEILTAMTSKQLSFAAKWVYRNSDLVIANSESTKNLLESIFSPGLVEIIHPGVDSQSFNPEKKKIIKFRKSFNWSSDTIILSTIARMEARKNHLQVIKSLHDLKKNGFNIAYVVGGEGEEKERLENLVNTLKLKDIVKFTGYLSEEKRILLFLISDIFVMPSIQSGSMIEGYGIAFIEAAAAGIPSISGNSGGQKEAVLSGKTGIVVDGNNFNELKTAIKYLVENEKVRRKMGASGKNWAKINDWINISKHTYDKISHLKSEAEPKSKILKKLSQYMERLLFAFYRGLSLISRSRK